MDNNICKFITPKAPAQLTISDFVYEQENTMSGAELTRPHHIMFIVSEGEGMYRCAREHYRLRAGTVFFTFADLPFCIENCKGLKYYYITFSGGRAEELFARFGVTAANAVFEGCEGLLPLWQDSIKRAEEDNVDLLSESLLLYTFSKLKRAEGGRRDAVTFVLGYLEEHFTDRDLTLNSVADEAGYNPKYLSHVFKREFGMGFSAYLRLMRIRHAVLLLEGGVTSVKNVAALCGFSDPLYFSKVFTDTVGVSPKNYKK